MVVPKVRLSAGPQLYKLVIQHHAADPEAAMQALRLAGAGARTRAVLAVTTWTDPDQRLRALLTLRSPSAILAGMKLAGWIDKTPQEIVGIDDDSFALLRKRAGQD